MGGGVAIQLPVSSTNTAPAAPRVASTARTPRSTSWRAAVTTGAPGPLSFVVAPSCSVTARLVRTAPAAGTQQNWTALAVSAVISGSLVGAGSTATASRPASVSARATLTPFPPGSEVTDE